MSKLANISPPESGPERNGDDLIVTLRIHDLNTIVRAQVDAALAAREQPVPRLCYRLEEAAEMISVPPTWLATKARQREIKSVRLGHYVTFTEQDLREFIATIRKQGT